jgi:glycosyltransferase involved in cell wall biosynthesis
MPLEKPGLVSVIIPVYNAEAFLGEALESVFAQTYRPIEVIVVDDGSTDGSAQVAQRFVSVHYTFQSHQGAAAARNQGLSLAQGEYIAFLDADDIWLKEKLAWQIAAFGIDPKPDLVFGHVQQFRSAKTTPMQQAPEDAAPAVPGLIPTTMVVRHEACQRVGPFEPRWRVAEFLDWYVRALELGLKSEMLPQVVARRRVHGTNLSFREREHRSDYVSVLKLALDRRRQSEKASSTDSSDVQETT